MKASSARNKGGRFENYLVERLKEVDPDTKRNYASGAGADKGDLRMPAHDFNVEAKNAMQIHLVKDFEQAERQCISGGTAVLIIRNPSKSEFSQSYAVMDLEDWMELVKKKTTVEVSEKLPDGLKWKLSRLKQYTNDLMKEL